MIGQSDKSQSRRLPVFLVGCAAVACCLVLLVLLGHGPGRQVVESIDRAAVDVMFRFRGPAETTGRVVIVTIDEKSLAALGQWPWPRDLTGQLLRRIAADKPRVIGMDVLFAEPDRTDPKRGPSLVRDLLKDKPQVEPAELDNDGRLAAAIAAAPVVLGYGFQFENDGLRDDNVQPCPRFYVPAAELPAAHAWACQAYRPICALPVLSEQARSEGHGNLLPDGSGICRAVPLLIGYADVFYPALSFEMVREGLGGPAALVSSRRSVVGLRLGERLIPTDSRGHFYLNFRGPEGSFPRVSAVAVLQGEVAAGTFTDRFVLVGATAVGIGDLVATPMSAACPGVEIHATAVDNMLAGDCMEFDAAANLGYTFMTVLLAGLALAALLAWMRPIPGTAIAILLLVGMVVGNYRFLFLNHRIVGLTFPLFSLFLVLAAITLYRGAKNHLPMGSGATGAETPPSAGGGRGTTGHEEKTPS